MASPCEVLVDPADHRLADRLLALAAGEARRIERKFSRYRDDNVVAALNRSAPGGAEVDDETAELLDFAARCFELSDGLFDITSGALRRVWRFDGSDRVPSPEQVEQCLPFIGWDRVTWQRPRLTLPPGMEIDLGGIAKEYAVDRCATLLGEVTSAGVLINFGGDLRAIGRRDADAHWQVGIERSDRQDVAGGVIRMRQGALATSGDARRYLLAGGVRYSHILDPRTGWPVPGAPRSVTVLAETCTEAGMLATMAHLRGTEAERFLDSQGVRYWCQR